MCSQFGFWCCNFVRDRTWLKMLDHKNLDAWTSNMPRVLGRGLKVLHFFSNQHMGDNECVKDFESACVAAHVWWLWGSWNDECVMCFTLRREYMLHCGSFRGSGNKGILESRLDYTHWSYLEFLSSL
jgi:hypothetical protein